MNSIVVQITDHFSLSSAAAEKLAAIMTPTTISKGDVFIREGGINELEYLVLKGICRSYVESADGIDFTLSFFTEISTISPNLTRTKEGVSILSMQALTEVSLVSFTSQGLMSLMAENREIELWANAVLTNELIQKVEKEINQVSKKAKQRLVDFRARYPQLENLIPHSYISSYLGITNVSLSRIRSELSNK